MNTESVNVKTKNIFKESTQGILTLINNEDAIVAGIVVKCIPQIAKLVDKAYESLQNGGKIVYCGAGTSGRLAIADAAECPPTYGVSKDVVKAVIAGGAGAVVNASEGCEDDVLKGEEAFENAGCNTGDIVIGISASGNAPFVCAFLKKAKEKGCITGAIVNNEDTKLEKIADITVAALTGAEAIKGSTRMKAGTSQKMILNMFSTAVFVKMGYVYQNYMVNMTVSNIKLKNRAIVMVSDITGLEYEKAEALLAENNWVIREAIYKYFEKK